MRPEPRPSSRRVLRGRRRAYGAAALTGLAGLLLACGEPRKSPAAWQIEGERLVAGGRSLAALARYAEAARQGERPAADLEAARLLVRHQKLGWALTRLRRLEEEFPGTDAIEELHYQTALANRLFDEAREAGARLLARRPEDAQLLRHLGVLAMEGHREVEAIDLLTRASRLRPDEAATWYALGRALEMASRDREAVEAYRRAVELSPGQAENGWRLARLLARRGERQGAHDLLAPLADRPDAPVSVLHLLGSLSVQLGDPDGGRRLLAAHSERQHAGEQREHAHIRYNALLEAAVGRLEADGPAAARGVLERAAEVPAGLRDERLELLHAELLLREGRTAQALERLLPVVRAHPQVWRYRYRLAEVLSSLGLRDEALAEVERALRLQPFALEAHLLRVELLAGAEPARRSAAEGDVRLLSEFAPPSEWAELRDGPLAGPARSRFLFDLVQIHPGARLAASDAIPLD